MDIDKLIEEVERLDKEATPGPWLYDPEKCWLPGFNGAKPINAAQEGVFYASGMETVCLTGPADDHQSMSDADLIATYRTAVPLLAAEVKRLRDVEADLRHRLVEAMPPEEREVRRRHALDVLRAQGGYPTLEEVKAPRAHVVDLEAANALAAAEIVKGGRHCIEVRAKAAAEVEELRLTLAELHQHGCPDRLTVALNGPHLRDAKMGGSREDHIGDYRNANGCRADRDGECSWENCPQLAEGEPGKTGRHCPLDGEGS